MEIRTFTWDDLPALVEIVNRSVEANQEDQGTTLDQLKGQFEQPYFGPLENVLVAEVDQRLAGYCTAELHPLEGRAWGSGHVDPAYRRQGIGAALLQAANQRQVARAGVEMAAGVPLEDTRWCRDTNQSTMTLLEAAGYHVARITWIMRMALEAPIIDVPPLPDGVSLKPFDRERDSLAVHAFEDAVFAKNWGFMPTPHEVWEHYAYAGYYAMLVAVQGDAIIGLCRCRNWGLDQPELGWIETVAVHEDWRKRGLGSALLKRGFQVLHDQGFTIAGLEVDSENRSKAVALYERAGMHVHRRYLIYRKPLRSG